MSREPTDERVGYGRPPAGTRFRKGQSGNPRGRPKGSRVQAPYERVLGQMVTIRENGVERRVTAAEAFLLHVTRRGLEGDSAAARSSLAALEDARARRFSSGENEPIQIVLCAVTPGSVNTALQALRMAVKQDRYRPTARTKIEPWLVEAALARLGERRLSPEEQAKVVASTRTPWRVRWPGWWEAKA